MKARRDSVRPAEPDLHVVRKDDRKMDRIDAHWTERRREDRQNEKQRRRHFQEAAKHKQQGVYREIVEPERIVFSYAFEDVNGVSGLSGWKPGHQTTVTVNFADHEGNKTKLTVRQTNFDTVAVRDDHIRGWNEALDHLADYVVSDSARS